MPEIVLDAEDTLVDCACHCVLSMALGSQALPLISKCGQHIKISRLESTLDDMFVNSFFHPTNSHSGQKQK